jgi:hypothetical protein
MLPLALALLLQIPAGPVAQAPAPPPPAPAPKPRPKYRYSVKPDAVTSLGSLGPREVRQVSWELRNDSDKPIAFRLVDLSPGTNLGTEPLATALAPGESRKLTATVDPKDWVGYQRRSIRLESDDATQPRYLLRMDFTVRPEVAVDSAAKDMGAVQRFESPAATFRFTREGGDIAVIRLTSPLPPYFEHEVVQDGVNASLVLTLRPSKLKPGQTAGLERLRVETSAPLQPRFNLTLAWRLAQPLEAAPSRLVLDQPGQFASTLKIRRGDGKPVKLLRAELAEGRGWAISKPDAAEAAEHELTVTLKDRRQRKGLLRITAEGLDEPLLVPLAYLPPEPPGKGVRPAPPKPEPPPAPAPDPHAGHKH